MLNLGGGSSASALIVTNANPSNLSSAASLPTTLDSVTLKQSLGLSEAICYYGNNCHVAPYNSLRGNPYFDVDARLAKNIKLGERMNLQLMFQAFNLFNHANYGNNFDGSIADIGAGAGNPNFGKPQGFINPSSTTLPRSFTGEFGARFTF
jgi:hypothetical protein